MAIRGSDLLVRFEGAVHAWLVRHSIDILRISMGVVFLGFGVLKFFPGVSPAQGLAEATIDKMTFGIVPDALALVLTAILECAIGISLITTMWLRLTAYLLALELLGILSPIVLLPGRLFAGPHHAPTLEGQYVIKDVVLLAAAMVVVTRFRGARIVLDESWQSPLEVADSALRDQARRKGLDQATAGEDRAALSTRRSNAEYS